MDVIVSGRANNETLTSVLNFRVEDASEEVQYLRVGGKDTLYKFSKISKDVSYTELRGENSPGFLYD